MCDSYAEKIRELKAEIERLRKALGKLVFAARYTTIAPDAIKAAEDELSK
jgi:hypothetical protein